MFLSHCLVVIFPTSCNLAKIMWAIVRKEWGQFFSGWMGYISIVVYLLVNGVLLFFIPDTNLLDAGYASLDSFFELSPLLLLILVPAITMRTFSDEYKMGTYEILSALPLKNRSLVLGKFMAVFIILFIALAGSLVYVFTLQNLSLNGLDTGAILGSYIGLLMLAAVYASIGIYVSSCFPNSLAAFMITAFCCFLIYYVFAFFPTFYVLNQNIGYYISFIGVKYHFENMSKGYLALNDLIYFISVVALFLYQTTHHLKKMN